MFKNRPFLLFLLLLLMPIFCWAQHDISGVILDQANRPIPDVTVKVKNIGVVTTSDAHGQFTIFAPVGKTLLFKGEGYKTSSFKIKENKAVRVVLKSKHKVDEKEVVTLTGKVTDESGEPLIGASILVLGTKNQALTDIDGKFTLAVEKGAEVEISYGCSWGNNPTYKIEKSGYRTFKLEELICWIPTSFNHTYYEKNDFNQGNFHHPLLLIKDKIAGLQIAKGGGNDPFGDYDVRIRGLTTLNTRGGNISQNPTNDRPLFVVDGLPMLDISQIDPLSITSVNVLKDGLSAKYGIRGANGVIEMNTNEFLEEGIRFHSYVGIDQVQQTLKFMNAEQFRNFAGNGVNQGTDLGAATDWTDEITRTAISQAHQLNLTGNTKGNRYNIGAIYRKAQGILDQQGFDRLQLNGHLQQKAFGEKLKINARLTTSRQNDNYSQPLALFYAQTMNPTAPIFNDTGEYYQENIFNKFNPVAIIAQNSSTGQQNNWLGSLKADWQLLPNFHLKGRYHFAHNKRQNSTYSSKNSFWGNGRFRNGYAEQNTYNRRNNFYDIGLNYAIFSTNTQGKIAIGHQYQKIEETLFGLAAGDFLTDAFGANNLAAAGDFANGLGRVNSNKSNHKLAAFYSDIFVEWEVIAVNAGLRREGSSRLGKNNRWGNFPYAAVELKLGQLWYDFFLGNQMKLRTSYGVAGNTPFSNNFNIDKEIIRLGNSFQNGSFQPIYNFNLNAQSNPNLKWEETATFNIGVDFTLRIGNKPLDASFDFYTQNATDLILPFNRSIGTSIFGRPVTAFIYDNSGALKSKGMEGRFSYDLIEKTNFSWEMDLVFSSTKTTLEKYYPEEIPFTPNLERIISSPTLGGCCKAPTVNLRKGMTVGEIWALDFQNIDAAGEFVYTDLNNNGFTDQGDFINAGNGLPNLTLGWTNRLQWGKLGIQAFFQGAFGHQNFNITRKLAENPTAFSTANLLTTTANAENRHITSFPQENNRYLENAGYLRLEYLTINYDFDWLNLYFTGQNLLTFTKYKGWDSAVRLDSFGDVFGAGYEYRTTYLPTRSFVFGVKVELE